MILNNKVLWSNDMVLAVGLKSELDEDEFIVAAQQTHLDLTGESLDMAEWKVSEDNMMRQLESID